MAMQSNSTSDQKENLHFAPPPSFPVLGLPVHAVQIPAVVSQIEDWIRGKVTRRYIAVTSMHGVAESLSDKDYARALLSADLVVPDGMPLVWLARWHGHTLARRVYGPELMESFCRETGGRYRHFFYGGAPGIADRLAENLQKRYGIVVAGTYSPPFRPLTQEERRALGVRVQQTSPEILWVGLSTPKQEKWMYENRWDLNVPVMLGVGAAFDFHSGTVRQAPRWMQENGLEWLFRLTTEPKRLWRRYLVAIPKATAFVVLDLAGFLPRSRKPLLST